MVYGSIGFFLRYFRSESSLWRYISDASYWMYLIHLMIIAGLQVFLLNFPLPALVKFASILTLTFVITLVSYHYFIRYTWVGNLLHGKRQKPEHEPNYADTQILLKKSR
jgi:glucan biosynthesis protein C